MKFLAVFLFLIFQGCASISPFVQDFNIVSVPQETAIGEKMAAEIAKESVFITDPALYGRVDTIGRRLAAALPRQDFKYRFYVINAKTPNAFTIPGGHIYVHSGLLSFVDNDSQLAGVLAHEIGHMYERHPAKGLSRIYGIEQFASVIFPHNENKLRDMAFQLAGGSVLTKFSREDEYEADHIGFLLLKRTGYPTAGLAGFLGKLVQLQAGGSAIPFMSTHPPTPDRIRRLEIMERTGGQLITDTQTTTHL